MDASSDTPLVATLGNHPLSIRTPRAPANDSAEEEPVTPTSRIMEPMYVVVTMGLGSPINLPAFRAAITATVARHPRFRSIQVKDGSEDGNAWWRPVTVNVDDHIIVPTLDVEADPNQVVEDYLASLFTLPMDWSCPLWEFHLLDLPTSEATSTLVIRMHHSLGDGVSLITLLLASSRSAADPTRLPNMPNQLPDMPKQLPDMPKQQPSRATGALASAWSYLMLAWNTAVGVAFYTATIMFLGDPHTLFRRREDKQGAYHPASRRFVHRSLSLDDIKFVKNAMNCTVNDVLAGLTSAALSRYYFRNSGGTNTQQISVRSILPVNLRPPMSLQAYVNMIESGKRSNVVLGNQLGYIILPFHLAMHDDPLAYVHKAKKTMDRKKSSLEVLFTYKMAAFFYKMLGLKATTFTTRGLLGNTTMTLSTLIGPAEKILICGHPVVFLAPSVYGIPQALIVHYQSYNRTMELILSVDDEIFPKYNQLLDDVSESLRQMKAAASRLSTSMKEK